MKRNELLALWEGMRRSIFGQEELLEETLSVFLSGGHMLITGVPGLAKTTLVRVFAAHCGILFGRVQFTPDLLPSDITGTEILDLDEESGKRRFRFAKGPIFTNLLLADEINRASPRTQAAMLEAMQERKITSGGNTYPLPEPFMVFATQNPLETEGTFPLPEAQLDRFLIHTLISYPSLEDELKILEAHAQDRLVGESHHAKKPETALTVKQMEDLQREVKNVPIPLELLGVINELVRSTRPNDPLCPEPLRKLLRYGAGPRAGIALISVAKALAFLEGEQEPLVRWRHIRRMAKPVLRHRIGLGQASWRDQVTGDSLIEELLIHKEKSSTRLI